MSRRSLCSLVVPPVILFSSASFALDAAIPSTTETEVTAPVPTSLAARDTSLDSKEPGAGNPAAPEPSGGPQRHPSSPASEDSATSPSAPATTEHEATAPATAELLRPPTLSAPPDDVVLQPLPLEPLPPEQAPEPPARLDYSDGAFYLRSINDNLVLVPSGRMHVDTYTFAGRGVSAYQRDNATGLKTNVFFRRFVLEMGGIVRKRWFFWLGGNFAPTTVDGAQASVSTSSVYDGFVGYMPTDHVRLYFGQFNAPFTMENVTSSRWMDMMERALIVRTVATPHNKADGLMVWGETSNKSFEYQAGIFGGDGMNRPNIDNRFDGMGRFLVRPLMTNGQGNRFHVGVSARYGSRDREFLRYDAPALSTPGGYTFWTPKYGSGANEVHIMPDAAQFSGAFELYAPFERFDVKSELIYVNEGRREAWASDRATTLRKGTFSGLGGYVQLAYWPLGSSHLTGHPAGYYGVTTLPKDLGKQDPYGLQLVARAELMRLSYDGDARSGSEATGSYAVTDDIQVNAYQFATNYWATKHVRLTAEYSLYQFPSSDNQAVAPERKLDATSNAEVLHEVSFRLGIAL